MSREGLIPQLQGHNIQVMTLKYGQQSVSVYQGTYRTYPAAIKILALAPGADYTQLEQECRTMISLSHENILNLYDCFWVNNGSSNYFAIVTEWCEKDLGKDMQLRATNNYPWAEEELWKLTFELVGALMYMQEQGISHRDIKPENIFLTLAKSVKLGDFGSARAFLSDMDYATLTGTPFYLSPKLKEALASHRTELVHNSYKSDVYSLGLTLLSLALLGPPLSLANGNVSNEEILTVINTVPYSDLFKFLLSQMLLVEEETRCDFKTLQGWIEANNPWHVAPPQSSDILCMNCQCVIDKFSQTAQCEVVQLYCEPSKHMFCSRDCFGAFLSLGNSKCPVCGVDIPIETAAFYRPVEQPDIEEEKHFSISNPDQPVPKAKTGEIECIQCKKAVDRYSTSAECEVAQLPCKPLEHMFCSRKCCKTYLCLGKFTCPQCDAKVPDETVVFYLTGQKPGKGLDLSSSGSEGNCQGKVKVSESEDSKMSAEISNLEEGQVKINGKNRKKKNKRKHHNPPPNTCHCCNSRCSVF